MTHFAYIGEVGDVVERDRVRGEQAGRESDERGVLGPRNVRTARKMPTSTNDQAVAGVRERCDC